MPVHLAFDNPTIIATYRTRHDAAMAKGRLNDQGIRAVLASDDAGGAYPQMQRTQGVRLVVDSPQAHEAWQVLEDLDMLPPDAPGSGGTLVGDGAGVWWTLGWGLIGMGGVVVLAAGIGWAVSGAGVALAVAGLGFALSIIGGLIGRGQGASGTEAASPTDG